MSSPSIDGSSVSSSPRAAGSRWTHGETHSFTPSARRRCRCGGRGARMACSRPSPRPHRSSHRRAPRHTRGLRRDRCSQGRADRRRRARGQVVLSQTTRDLIENDADLRDLGLHRLKDLTAPSASFFENWIVPSASPHSTRRIFRSRRARSWAGKGARAAGDPACEGASVTVTVPEEPVRRALRCRQRLSWSARSRTECSGFRWRA